MSQRKEFDMTKKYTDIKQSKILAEILPIESADMSYSIIHNVGQEPYHCNVPTFVHAMNGDIPCWSLPALLDVLPFPQLSKDKLGSGKEGWMVSVYPNDCRYDSCWHDNPIDACVAMIEKLHKLNLL